MLLATDKTWRLLPIAYVLLVLLENFDWINADAERYRRQALSPYAFYQNVTFGLDSQDPEFGPWGPWTERSDCTRTCGGGISYQDRICMNVRADGSHTCVGASRRYFSCNLQECPPSSRNFREEQCASFNTLPYEGKYYSWLPYYKVDNPCELNCIPKGATFYTRHAKKVIDGTRCRDDASLDVCVEGVCVPVGCDMVLGSTTKEDECRVCGGDGTSCRIVKGILDKDDFQIGYNDILLIPIGATAILIREVQPTINFLAVRNAAGDYYLNGNWKIDYPKQISFAGTLFHYEKDSIAPNSPERLRARGPTTEPIFIVLLYQEKNLGVGYEYSIPVTVSTDTPDTYKWTFGDFEECSQTCGGGVQYRPVRCVRSSNKDIVEEELCDATLKPAVNSTCNIQPCPAGWQIGEWSNCSHPCGVGTQFRIVFCKQSKEGDATVLVPDELCEGSKPLFMRACNIDKDCPDWVTGEWSECDKECGIGNMTRTIKCRSKETNETIEDSQCVTSKPKEFEECNLGPCEGVEWIVSEWSGCEGSCSPQMESREVHCANENGVVFTDDVCEASRKPMLTRPCPLSVLCDPMWHTSQWTDCSVKCGHGVQNRLVFCGAWQDDSVIKIEDKMCDPEKKFSDVQNCSAASCKGIWFTGPWDRCSAPCGGGERTRRLLCFHEDEVVDDNQCDPNEQPFAKETCNMTPCDEDEIMVFGGCKDTKYGCCPDGMTPAGFNYEGCPKMNATDNVTCEEAEYGCCADGFTLALGPFKKGCPLLISCNDTKYGCCPDDLTPADGPNMEGCFLEETNCTNTTYGCCLDGIREASGPNLKGCDEDTGGSGEDCYTTKFGCCPDALSEATGPDQEGCEGNATDCKTSAFGCCEDNVSFATGPFQEGCMDEGSGDGMIFESCGETMFGCCPDNVTAAKGFDGEGCPIDCSNTTFGCCPDNTTVALGPDEEGCYELPCYNSTYGCCPDNVTTALGPDGEGCIPDDCSNSTYGCCPDNVTLALGPDGEGCVSEDCVNSTYGCCPDNITLALGPDEEGCYPEDCSNTTFGCCPDNITAASGPDEEGCTPEDCSNSTFGCCPDNITLALGPDGEGCFPKDCSNTTFGCCPDNVTLALGPDGEGCFPEDCSNTTFGCCPDNITSATGPDEEGCLPEDCSNSTYGCCPDNVTAASGPDEEGCLPEDCSNSTFGCCPDNVTVALGPDEEGCIPEDCMNSTYGCCSDNVTLALGPDGEGCFPEDCSNTTFGCCPDNITTATGPDEEGCLPVDCSNSTYGCCPDNVTLALGPENQGCEEISNCTASEFGCCPDEMTAADGPDFEGCNVTITTMPTPETTLTTEKPPECLNTMFGCCPDEVTTALGPRLEGCCFGMRFSCCPDNMTAALGPGYLGCGCQTFPYGCCPDNITPAQGFQFKGCRCEHFRYGCCQDNITPATGPHYEGCLCQLMHYGCCPDGVTAVLNEKGEGCGCDSTRYGCCPDGRTAATSADLSGCPCDTLPYGCCPDGRTPARTSDHRDCPCETQRFGCCLDGRTPAAGYNYEGCPCESTRFGCCADDRTTAQGPDMEGCPCELTRYGCCADGFTRAKSPDLQGCPAVKVPKPPVSTEVCGRPKEPGPCLNYTVKWYFDVSYGACSRFWYGGCEGNGNVFDSRNDCEAACVYPEGPEVCFLPKVIGSCDGKHPSWYYDVGSKSCESFMYSGCLGNNNRFATMEICEQNCIHQKPVPQEDICDLPSDVGPCDKAIIQWYYNKPNVRCEQFYYSGCKGNANRFESRSACEQTCLAPTTTDADVCRQPQKMGSCYEFRERWYYDYESNQCLRFYFSGCDGNDNNFGTQYECEEKCGTKSTTESPIEEVFKLEYCFQAPDTGPCSSSELNWYYDSSDGVCKEFYYGGCRGNSNRFKTRKDCETSCYHAQDVCGLPAVIGPCSGSFAQWYYDERQDDCFEFLFSGCQGNGNRFNSRESCYSRCKKHVPTTTHAPVTDNVCTLSQEPGPCLGYYRMWYYDNSENICKSFVYGGCDGNGNRFEKRSECELRCVKKIARDPTIVLPEPPRSSNEDVCRLPVDAGPCSEEHQRWFYDAESQACLPFVFGGCGGNKNRFKTSEICLRFCTGIKATPDAHTSVYIPTGLTTPAPVICPPSKCEEIQCPYGVEESFDTNGCSSCRCSNPCEVHECPEGSRCAIEVARTSQEGIRTEPVCRRMSKPGECPATENQRSSFRDCETRCRDDADCYGEHKCCHNGCAFVCLPPEEDQRVPATQPEPARIIPGMNVTEARIGAPAQLPCNAVGWPRPTVTWWRDATMLPISSHRYQQLPDYALLIRSVVYEDGGDYACHAHNGIGSGATYRVTLIIDLGVHAHGEEDVYSREAEPMLPPPPEVATESPPVDVPLVARVTVVTTEPTAGSHLQIDCITEGPKPGTSVTWYFDNTALQGDDRRRILSNQTLYITRAELSDSGEYRCVASYEHNVASSAVSVTVTEKPTESSCIDNPQFSNCELIVKANYCNNKHYGKFCCASCLKAGQLQNWPTT